MSVLIAARRGLRVVPLETVDAAALPACRRRLSAVQRRWLDASGFDARSGAVALLPDARIFMLLCHRLDCPPQQVLHVGDDPLLDVDGARAAGLRAAWLNRDGRAWAGPGPAPELVFTDLGELADWCEQHLAAAAPARPA